GRAAGAARYAGGTSAARKESGSSRRQRESRNMTCFARWSPTFGVVALTVMVTACGGRVEAEATLAEGLSYATDSNGWCFPCAMSIVTTEGDTITVDSTA